MSEADLIARARELFPLAGDDGAVIGTQIITTDMLIEDVDFTAAIPLRFIARKSIAVNVSDLAAMGARPGHALVAVGIPPWVDGHRFLEELAAGARAFSVEIAGGDISRAAKLIVAVTAFGEAKRPLLRSTARGGDRIYISRPLGGSASGLFLLQHGWSIDDRLQARREGSSYLQREFASSAIRHHVDPEPETELGMALGQLEQVTSCIDVSDGLSTDLHNLCAASHLGASIERERIPLFDDLSGAGSSLGVHVEQAVLHGGEEYALLFTSSLRESQLSSSLRRPVYAIGRMTEETGVVRLNGEPLQPQGWDHFRDEG